MEKYLVHHGIKGQKWGVRRYQNEDGTLTPLGRSRERGDASKDASSSVYRRGDGLNSSSSQRSRSNGGYSQQSRGSRGSVLKSNTNSANWKPSSGRSDYIIKKGGKLSPVKQQGKLEGTNMFRGGSGSSDGSGKFTTTYHDDLDGKPGHATEASISEYQEPEDEYEKAKSKHYAVSKQSASSAAQTAAETISSLTKMTETRAAIVMAYKMNHLGSNAPVFDATNPKLKQFNQTMARVANTVVSSISNFFSGKNTKSNKKKNK